MKIVYWSGTGNTESMAELIGKGIKEGGKDVEILRVDEVNIDELLKDDVLTLGCPAMGDEVLEEGEFEPFIESICDKVSGKKVNLFGSYGWGDGQWMRDWEERMKNCGCTITEEPLIFQGEADEEECIKFGKKIALL
ncbi:MAG: flavodoxin [Clostridium sp.]|nr:flavodoxin [Clostridium sp.]